MRLSLSLLVVSFVLTVPAAPVEAGARTRSAVLRLLAERAWEAVSVSAMAPHLTQAACQQPATTAPARVSHGAVGALKHGRRGARPSQVSMSTSVEARRRCAPAARLSAAGSAAGRALPPHHRRRTRWPRLRSRGPSCHPERQGEGKKGTPEGRAERIACAAVLDSTAVHFDREDSTLFDIDTNRTDIWLPRATPVIAASPLQTNASLG